jgi:sugar phosphate isomerase/epimerase
MNLSYPKFPFKIGASSMVFGKDLLKNVRTLAGLLDHIEIVLFNTPHLHNIPRGREIRLLKQIGGQEKVTFTIHLPPSLEIASPDKKKREESLRLAKELCLKTMGFEPKYYILHLPFSPPTLVPIPGLYFNTENQEDWDGWTNRAFESLEILHDVLGQSNKLLIENINYSPYFLEPFMNQGLCELCLDLGHLILGQEHVMDSLKRYLKFTRVIHLHGVKGYEDHLSLSILPKNLVHEWMIYLKKAPFQGEIVLEVFSPQDLKESLNIVLETPCH